MFQGQKGSTLASRAAGGESDTVLFGSGPGWAPRVLFLGGAGCRIKALSFGLRIG